jgi:hypothetical protein
MVPACHEVPVIVEDHDYFACVPHLLSNPIIESRRVGNQVEEWEVIE